MGLPVLDLADFFMAPYSTGATDERLTTERGTQILQGFSDRVQEFISIRRRRISSTHPPSQFAEVVRYLLTELDWTSKELAERSAISVSQLSSWLSNKERGIGPDDCCRLAWAIASRLDNVGIVDQPWGERHGGRGNLDILVNGLLVLGGFSSGVRYKDVIWRDKILGRSSEREANTAPLAAEKALVVGWFDWEPLTESEFSGPARKITDAICQLIGKPEPQYVYVPFTQIEVALRERQIDLVAPLLLRFARRRRWFRFTRDLPIRINFDIVVQRKHWEEIRTTEEHSGVVLTSHLRDRLDIRVNHGEVTETAGPLLVPWASIEAVKRRTGLQLVEELVQTPWGSPERIPAVLTNGLNCAVASKHYPNDLIRLSDVSQDLLLEKFSLPLGLAVHPDEPNLLEAIDEAIDELTSLEFFDRLLEQEKTLKLALFQSKGEKTKPRHFRKRRGEAE